MAASGPGVESDAMRANDLDISGWRMGGAAACWKRDSMAFASHWILLVRVELIAHYHLF